MRLHLRLTPSTEPLPFNHHHRLMGVLHRWLGEDNLYHEGQSFYGFGMLQGARVRRGKLVFPDGADWDVGFFVREGARDLVGGILDDPGVTAGMRVDDVEVVPAPSFDRPHRFRVLSPVLARKRTDAGRDYLLWDDPEADAVLTASFRRKMQAAGLSGTDLEATVRFDRDYPKARTKLLRVREAAHKGSLCPVWIDGSRAALAFAWRVGVGDLTGSGFGMVA